MIAPLFRFLLLAGVGLCGLSKLGPAIALEANSPGTLPRVPDTASVDACLKREATVCSVSALTTHVPADASEPRHPEISTAFAINTKGDFLTNYHVVAGCTALQANITGDWVNAQVIAIDADDDLAVVRVSPKKTVPVLRFRDGRNIRPAELVIALGFPYAGLLTTDPQVTTGVVSALAGLRNDKRYLQLSAPVQPGSSGGPLLDLSGNVVGVVTAKLNKFAAAQWTGLSPLNGTLPENVNFAIKSENATRVLEARGLDYEKAFSTTKLDPADVGETAARSVIMVKCE